MPVIDRWSAIHPLHRIRTCFYKHLSPWDGEIFGPSHLDNLVLNVRITPRLPRHELFALHGVAIDRKRYRRRLEPPPPLLQQAASGPVRVHHVKTSAVDVDCAADANVINGVGPRSLVR